MSFARPAEQWKAGYCVNLPSEARCGVFFSAKGDNCEAELFNAPDCYKSPTTFVNTVVFMPEERAIGGLYQSMRVKCAVEVPDGAVIDPAVLGSALKKGG